MALYYPVSATTEGSDIESENASASATVAASAPSEAQQALATFWPRVTEEIRKTGLLDLKTQALPLARIKKIMKLDEDVKMISAEAPMLFAKAAEIFIHELTLRAWVHTEDNKRRTLQRNDIAMAISKYDQFDFLIDIVPREDIPKPAKAAPEAARGSMSSDQIHYYFQLAQQHQQALQQSNSNTTTTTPATTTPTIQIVQPSSTQIVQMASVNNASSQASSSSTQILASPRPQSVRASSVSQGQSQQIIQIQQPSSSSQAAQQAVSAATGGIQIVQQIVTPSGEVQQVPIQLSAEQMQMIRMQLQGNSSQSAIIQIQPQIIQQ